MAALFFCRHAPNFKALRIWTSVRSELVDALMAAILDQSKIEQCVVRCSPVCKA
jgi:hypothetical protein